MNLKTQIELVGLGQQMRKSKIDISDVAKLLDVDIKTLGYREDGRIEWHCEHDVGHTVYSPDGFYVHGCCGCCRNDKFKKAIEKLA